MRFLTCAFFFLLFNLTTASAQGQKSSVSVPQAAREHFAQHYPKAAKLEWKEGSKQMKAEFELKGEFYKAVYKTTGEWVRTEHNIPKTQLPAAIGATLKAGKYAEWKIEGVEEQSTPEHPTVYKVKVETTTTKAELFFTPEGKMLREEEKAKK